MSFFPHAKPRQIVKGVTGTWACSQGWGTLVPWWGFLSLMWLGTKATGAELFRDWATCCHVPPLAAPAHFSLPVLGELVRSGHLAPIVLLGEIWSLSCPRATIAIYVGRAQESPCASERLFLLARSHWDICITLHKSISLACSLAQGVSLHDRPVMFYWLCKIPMKTGLVRPVPLFADLF